MHARLRGPNNLLILHLIIKIEPDFPCLADEIAKPRPEVNIKVAAFTVREKSINTKVRFSHKTDKNPLLSVADYCRHNSSFMAVQRHNVCREVIISRFILAEFILT